MPNRVEFAEDLLHGVARLRARWETNGNEVTTFTVQLEAWHDGEWLGIRRYDDAHGSPHVDILDRQRNEYHKVWLNCTRSDALTLALRDIHGNWERFLAEYTEG